MPRTQGPALKSKAKRSWTIFGIGCGVFIVIITILLALYLIIGWQSYQDAPRIFSDVDSDVLVIEEYDLSDDQLDVYISYGYPEAFRILFFDEMLPDGSVMAVRLETWTYYGQSVELTFQNGIKTGEDLVENPGLGDLITPPYYPEQFTTYMSLDEVITAVGLDEYIVFPLEKEFIDGSEVYFGHQLSFGLKDGELRMIDVMGIVE